MTPSDFFQVGGSLERGHPSYIERPADRQLIDTIEKGDLCLVLAPRQTGKSSLMVHALARLEDKGLRWAVTDLQALGHHRDLNAWFGDVIYQIARTLKLSTDAMQWWEAHGRLGPTQRFMTFIEDVVLGEIKERVVVFFDEIDSVLTLPFSDDFFTILRTLVNASANNPILKRIAFALLGVATPSEFIKNRSRTPFNIGKEIALSDFNPVDATPFKNILGPLAEPLVDRIFYWTGGQPFLIQALTAKVHALPETERTIERLDALVRATYLKARIEKDTHLNFIRDYLLERRHHPRKMLKTYRAVITGELVEHDETSLVHARLLLSGVVRLEDGHLVARNRIYQSIFNEQWIKDNLPRNKVKIVSYVSSIALVTVLLWFFLIDPLWFRFLNLQKYPWFDSDIYYVTQSDYILSIAKPLDKPRKITVNGIPFEPEDTPETTQAGQVRFEFSSLKAGPNHFKVRFYGAWLQENFETYLTIVYYPESEWKAPDGLDMVAVPAGCFDMGCGPWADSCREDEKPVHHVCLADFAIGKFEVTQGQWQALMGYSPSTFKGDTRLPVENVRWEDVQEYIHRLNQVTGQRYRLPSEAQWEYAARSGGRPEKYAGGEDLDTLGWYAENSGERPHPVGGKAANGLGLYDMSGNVWEWCSDWYGNEYYRNSPMDNPEGPETGSYRVFRGGGWSYPAWYCRSASRHWLEPGVRDFGLGFRLVLLPGQRAKQGAESKASAAWRAAAEPARNQMRLFMEPWQANR